MPPEPTMPATILRIPTLAAARPVRLCAVPTPGATQPRQFSAGDRATLLLLSYALPLCVVWFGRDEGDIWASVEGTSPRSTTALSVLCGPERDAAAHLPGAGRDAERSAGFDAASEKTNEAVMLRARIAAVTGTMAGPTQRVTKEHEPEAARQADKPSGESDGLAVAGEADLMS